MPNNDLGEILELRADRSLLNPRFEHYLLSNRPVQLRKTTLPSGAHFTSPSSVQFSFQHAKLYSQVDRLVWDLFNSSNSGDHLYTFLHDGRLVKAVYKPTLLTFFSLTGVATVHLDNERKDTLPPSLLFADSNCALISNGAGQLTVYNTKDRLCEEQWEPIVSYIVLIDGESNTVAIAPSAESTNIGGLPFLIVDVRQKEGQLSILLEAITEKAGDTSTEHSQEKSLFHCRLIWLDLNSTNGAITRTRELHFNAPLETATLNHDATEVITVGATNPLFVFDSFKPIVVEPMDVVMDSNTETTTSSKKPLYVWTQDAEEITVTFALAESIKRSDVSYHLTSQEVDLEIKGVKVLVGRLEGTVHLDSSTWTIHDNSLQITLFKARGHYWRELVVGDSRGVYQQDPQLISNVLDNLEKFTSDSQTVSGETQSTFNTEQLEECDNSTEQTIFICWTSGDTHKCIQTMDAGSAQVLFETRLKPGGPKAIAIRQENDGIVWSLEEEDLAPGKRIAHKYTLDAYGYIQAGHVQKMFSGASPDGSYATVIHTGHHAFVYLQNVPVGNGCELVNRKTKQQYQDVKEQLVINVASSSEEADMFNSSFIGYSVSNNVLYLLTRRTIVACHIKA